MEAFVERDGPRGRYYHLEFELAVTFDAILKFRMMWNGSLIGEARATYS